MYLAGVRSFGNEIDIWDYGSNEFVATLVPRGRHQYDSCYSFSSDGRMLAVSSAGNQRVYLYDISNMEDCIELFNLECADTYFANVVSFSKNDDYVYAGFDGKVLLCAVANGTLLRTADGHAGPISCIQHVGDRILTGSEEGILQEWTTGLDSVRSRQLGDSICQMCVARSEDIIAVSLAGKRIVVITVATFEQSTIITATECCMEVQFNSAGSRLFAGGCVYDVCSGSRLFQLVSGYAMCYSLDGSYIYGSTGKVSCWDAETGTEIESSSPSSRQSKHKKLFFSRAFDGNLDVVFGQTGGRGKGLATLPS
jgi:WD40 repeat protein